MANDLSHAGNPFDQRVVMQKMPNPNPPKMQTLLERVKEQIEAEKAREPIRKLEEMRRIKNKAAGLAMQILQVRATDEADWRELEGNAVALVQDGIVFVYDENVTNTGFVVYYNKDKRVKLLKDDGTLGEGQILGQIHSFNDLCILLADVM